jgi:transposase
MSGDGKMGVQLDVPSDGYAGRLEVIEGPTGRRRWSEAEKARIAAASLLPGVRVAEVARRHGVTRWQVYDWRRQLRQGRLALPGDAASAPPFAALVVEEPPQPKPMGGRIEIVVGNVVIRTEPDVDGRHLAQVIRAVRAAT